VALLLESALRRCSQENKPWRVERSADLSFWPDSRRAVCILPVSPEPAPMGPEPFCHQPTDLGEL